MKINGKKYGIASFILFFGAAVIGICFLLIGYNKQRKLNLEKESRGFYSKAAQKFRVFEGASEDRLMNALSSSIENGLVYSMHLDSMDTLQGVWYQGDIEKPALADGEFFDEKDFTENTNKAVIGKACLKDTTQKDGIIFLEIDGEEYEVIGVFDADEDTRMGQMKFINLNAAFKTYGAAGDYLLDGRNTQTIRTEMEMLSEKMYSDEFYYSPEKPEDNSLVRVFGLETLDAIYLIMSANFVICGIFITIYWLHKKKGYAEVYSLLGIRRKYFIADILKTYGLTVLSGFLLGFFCYILLRG